jgi:hypothetical protein
MGGYPGTGPRLICPGRRKYPQLHEQLVKKRLSVADNGHHGHDYLPKSIIKELQEEIKQDLERFRKVKPNVVLPPPSPL